MADLDFSGILNSLLPGDINTAFGGIYTQHDPSSITDNPTLPPALINDVLDFDFGTQSTKHEMLDLFTPSISNPDQFLDNLISEMDKVDQDNQYSQLTNFEHSFFTPALQQSDSHFYDASSTQAASFTQFEHNAAASSSANVQNHWQHDIQSQSNFQQLGTCSESSAKYSINQPLPQNNFVDSAPDFFLEQSLPQPAETVEVEYAFGDEHSYASCDEKMSHATTTTASPCNRGSSHSPFSSSSSVRSGTSSFSDHTNNNSLGHNWHFAKIKHPVDNSRLSSASIKYSYGINFEDDDEEANFDLANFRAGSSNYSHSNSFLKRGCRRRVRQSFMSNLSSRCRDFGRDDKFPNLTLSDEERVLAEKEGIRLPTQFPLTKQEERELRRIRRKIRNKHSAQESRRKKHEYISSLEDRVKACDRDNNALRRHVETLSKTNKTLAEQLRRLQSTVGTNSSHVKPTVQAGTCLAVLLLSFALLVAPNYNLFGKRGKLNKINSSSSSYNNGRVDNDLQQPSNNDNVKSFGGSLSRIIQSGGNSKSLLHLPDDFEIGDNVESFLATEDDFLNASSGSAGLGAKKMGGLERGRGDPRMADGDGGGGAAHLTPPPSNDDKWWAGDLDVVLPDNKRIKLEVGDGNQSWHRPTSVVLRQRGVKAEEF